MAIYDAKKSLPGGEPGPWGEAVSIRYDPRDVLLYAVGIGASDLRFVYEKHPAFAVFPTFPIRWGGAGAPIDPALVPPSPGPLNIDAERLIEQLRPLPLSGSVSVRSRLIGVHPRGKGNGFVETESTVTDADGNLCVRMVSGSYRRGVERLGDIEPFEGAGQTHSVRIDPPGRAPDLVLEARIADNQAHLYRLSGDYNPLHIDPDAARFGGFERPILHGLCTYGTTCRAIISSPICNYDPTLITGFDVRFSSPVFPGETIAVDLWKDGNIVSFRARVKERDVVVINNGKCTLRA